MEEEFKEFEAKNLDGAIALACEFFGTERAKLEIEILQDAKSGIFGIVGVRKAKVRARRVHVRETIESILGKDTDNRGKTRERRDRRSDREDAPSRNEHTQAQTDAKAELRADTNAESGPEAKAEARTEQKRDDGRQERRRGRQGQHAHTPAAQTDSQSSSGPRPEQAHAKGEQGSKRARPPKVHDTMPPAGEFADNDADDAEGLGYPSTPLESLDRDTLIATVEKVTRELVRPIAGTPATLETVIEQGRVQVRLDCGEDSGLLIGREGMTLAALQYILSRVVSCTMNASVRVQLDAGDYRRHQEDKLREMARALAERARQTGRSYSTRPLSSYHRRIVHLALQGMEDIQSRSSGDGALKRVVISKRRMERTERNSQQ